MEYPTGTVTFFFTDIEGSTELARGHRDTWESVKKKFRVLQELGDLLI